MNGGNCAIQYPCDGWVDNYNLKPTPSIGRIAKLVPSSTDNRWRVQTPSNMPIERFKRDRPTPPLSLCVPPPPFVSDKSVSKSCLIITERLCAGMRHLYAPLRNHRLSVQVQSIYCGLSSTMFQSLASFFFLGQNLNRFQPYCFLLWMFSKNSM